MKAEVNCYECNTTSIIEIEEAGDLPDIVCPKCGNEHIFFGNIECEDNNEPFKLPGTGGCGRVG